MTDTPRICIIGAGAVGGLIAAGLAQAGAAVSVLARGETLAAIRRDGLVARAEGRDITGPVKASADPAELGPQDFVIVAVKAPSLPAIAPALQVLLGSDGVAVSAMNGVPWWLAPGCPPWRAATCRRSTATARWAASRPPAAPSAVSST